jgi:hypothetical protein
MDMTYALGNWRIKVKWIWINIRLLMNISPLNMYNTYFLISHKFKICIYTYSSIIHIDNQVELNNETTMVLKSSTKVKCLMRVWGLEWELKILRELITICV